MNGWNDLLAAQRQQPYFQKLEAFVEDERRAGKTIYPPQELVFTAFSLTPLEQVKVVILGQDPYHGPGQAHGLSFSVPNGIKIPPSLNNIYKELAASIEGFTRPNHGNLTHWAEQGVLLLNAVMTVEEGKANSHAKRGWETFTDNVIDHLNQHREGVIFMLWGSHAQRKGQYIDRARHHVLTAPHPSPLSAHRGFLGCGHFSHTNTLLRAQQRTPIDWQV